MSQTQNEVKEIVENWIDNKINNIHTALSGKIISYNSSNNRATVQPSGVYKANDYREFSYPLIYNVPVVFPTGLNGGAGVTFPITGGDGCLIIFSEKQLDDFINNNNNSEDLRTHSLNDAICIPGLYTNATQSNIKNPDCLCLFNGNSILKLNSNSLTGNIGGTTLNIGGGDLVVNGISLVNHVHGGVQPGGSSTSKPQ